MARSAAARLLSSSSPPLRSSHQHHRPHRALLLPTSRSKTSSSKPPRPPPPRRDAAAPAHSPAGPRPSLFQEISGLVAPNAGTARDPPFQPRRNWKEVRTDDAHAQCTEGARPIAPASVAAASAAFNVRVPDQEALGGDAGNVGGPSVYAESAESRLEASCQVVDHGKVQDCDLDVISSDVQRITEILRSEVPGFSEEQRLANLGVAYTPTIVNMVLKRCFKKKQLGLGFFYWVKGVPGFHHTTETYNTILYIAGESKSIGVMEQLISEMDKDMCPKDIKTWTIIIASYGKARQISKMLSTFHATRKSVSVAADSKVYRMILRALCNDARHDLAHEFYKDMPKNMDVGSDILKLLLCLLAKFDNAEAVLSIRDDMIKSMRYPEEYCYLETLRSFCVSGKIVEAQKVCQQMGSKSIANSSAFEILLRGFCKGGMMDEALQLMGYMKSRSCINSAALGFIIDGYLRKGDLTKALELLQGMKGYGCVPLASSYTQVMQHLFTSDQYEAACELYKEMQANGVEPDIVSITALICGHIRNGHVSEAWDVLTKIDENGQRPTMKSYTVFIQELCKASRPLMASELLKEMLNADYRPSEGIFCRVISALRENNYFEEASNVERMRASLNFGLPKEEPQCGPSEKIGITDQFQILSKSDPEERKMALESFSHSSDEDSEISRCSPSVDKHYIEQAKSYRDEDVEEICQILSSCDKWSSIQQALEMRSLHFTPDLVSAIMKRCKSKSQAALKFFSWVGKRSYYIHTTETYNAAMKLAGSAKDFKYMRHLYREMVWAQCSPTVNTWNVMICQYGNAGLTEMALKAFYQMKQDGFQPDKTTFNHLIMYLSRRKGRKADEAVKVFKEMSCAGYILDNEVLCTYLSGLCECGMLADARSSIVSLCKRGFAAQVAYSILLTSLCRSDRMEEAVGLFDNIEKHGLSRDAYMYGSLIHALLRWDRFEDAVDKLAEMKNAGIHQSTHMYTSFVTYFFRKRDVAKAMDVLKEMTENGCVPNVITCCALIRGHMAMGMVREAWDVFQRMKLKGPSPDFETYSMFMTYLCKAGRPEEALQLIHDMLDVDIIPSTVNFRTVIHGLNMEGKHKLADSVLRLKSHLRRQRTFSDSFAVDSFV